MEAQQQKAIKRAIRKAFEEYGLSVAPELANHAAALIAAELQANAQPKTDARVLDNGGANEHSE